MGGFFDFLGGGTDDQEVTQSTAPWGPLQGPLKDLISRFSDASAGYNPTYGPDRYSGLVPGQQQALNDLFKMGSYGVPGMDQSRSFLDKEMRMGMGPGYGFYGDMGKGSFDNPYQNLYKNTFNNIDSSTGLSTLNDFASGKYMGSNPYLDKMVDSGLSDIGRNFSESVNPGIEGMMSRSGGGGGSMEALLRAKAAGEMTDSMGQFEQNMRGSAYESDMGRMLSAAGQIPGAMATDTSTRLGALGAMSGIHDQDIARRSAGFGQQNLLRNQEFDRNSQTMGMYGDLWDQMMKGPEAMLAAGGMQQQDQQNWINEAVQQHQFNQQQPFMALDPMSQFLQSLQGFGSSSATQVPGRGASFGTGVQNVAGIGSLFSGLFDWYGGGGGGEISGGADASY